MMQTDLFKYKGSAILAARNFLDKEFGSGYFNRYWSNYQQDILIQATNWYPLEFLVNILYQTTSNVNLSFRELVLKQSGMMLVNKTNGIYRHILEKGGMKKILVALPHLEKTYNTSSHIKNLEINEGYYKLEMINPVQYSDYSVICLEGGLAGIISVCGEKIIEFNILERELFIENNIEYAKVICEVKYK